MDNQTTNFVIADLSKGKSGWSLRTIINVNKHASQLRQILQIEKNGTFYKAYCLRYFTPDGLIYTSPSEYIKVVVNYRKLAIMEKMLVNPNLLFFAAYAAALYQYSDIVNWLIQRGYREYHIFLRYTLSVDIIEQMRFLGANNYNDCMYNATLYNRLDIVQLMLNYGANDIDQCFKMAHLNETTIRFFVQKGGDPTCVLKSAVITGNIDLVNLCLELGATGINDAMDSAICTGNIEACKILYPLTKDYDFNKEIQSVAYWDRLEILKLLITYGLTDFDNLLFLASEQCANNIIDYIINLKTYDSQLVNTCISNLYRYDRIFRDSTISIIKLLPLSYKRFNHFLFLECSNPHSKLEVVTYLISLGANNIDKCLISAVKFGKLDLVKLLMTYTTNYKSAINYAKKYKYDQIVKLFQN